MRSLGLLHRRPVQSGQRGQPIGIIAVIIREGVVQRCCWRLEVKVRWQHYGLQGAVVNHWRRDGRVAKAFRQVVVVIIIGG